MRHDVGPKGVNGFYRLRTSHTTPYVEQDWKHQIFFGLRMAALEYNVTICYWCEASGTKKHYDCEVCKGACLLQNGQPAPASVVMQVYNAGAAWRVVSDVV